MTIDPKSGQRQVRKIVTFDFEWTQRPQPDGTIALNIRLCGLFDGWRYRHFFTIADFLNHVLTRRYENVWLYAHAGGLADITFVLEEIVRRRGEYEVEASFSGSSAIIVRVKKGRHSWLFLDSYWTLRDKLANIAKMVGMEKGEIDFDTPNVKELIRYNEQDCRILWHALDTFETGILDLGSQLNMTQASTAMELFKRRFLKASVKTSDYVNERARLSYHASRVEVIREYCDDAFYFDINSSFPYAMTFEAPGSIIGSSTRLPRAGLYLAQLKVEVPEMYLPPLPHRVEAGGSVYFPTGVWDGWFMNVDVELLEREGGRILKVGEVISFEPFHDLAEYATTLYQKRLKATSDAEKLITKILLNSLYGKFAETSVKSKMLVYPTTVGCPHDPQHGQHPDYPLLPSCMETIFPGVYLLHTEVQVAHVHVPISSHITAIARKNLYDYLKDSMPVYYCDTDSLITEKEHPTSTELGKLKLEKVVHKGRFLLPKVYTIDHPPDKDGIERTTRAKGFTLGDKMVLKRATEARLKTEGPHTKEEISRAVAVDAAEHDYKQFIRLADGRDIEFRRMSRVREMFRSGIAAPYDQIISKKLQHKARHKRAAAGKGDTRPWTIDELQPE